MNKVIRAVLLAIACAAFLVFLSVNVMNLAGMQTVTVGLNASPHVSPWLRYSRVKGLEKFTEQWQVKLLSWSALGLPVGIAVLIVRSRIKG